MDIKMPIKFHGSYLVTTRIGNSSKRERCQKLTIRELSAGERTKPFGELNACDEPTHQITFYDFGCKRLFNGFLKENEEERVVFQVQEKEYEFSIMKPVRHES